MSIKRLLALSLMYKCLLVGMCLSIIYMHYVVGKVWFDPASTIDQVEKALREGADPNMYNENGLTGLMQLSKFPNVLIVKALLNAGADPNLQSKKEGNTALHFACQNGGMDTAVEIIRLLIKNNAYVRARNKLGDTPLHQLSLVEDPDHSIELITYLIKNGADVNIQNNQGKTLLHTLVEMNELFIIRLYVEKFGPLIKFGIKSIQQYTAAEYADYLGFTDIATAIIDAERNTSMINVGERYLGLTGIMLAIMRSDKELMMRFIGQKEDINATSNDEFRNTALHVAELYGNFELLRILIDSGANRIIPNSTGNTPVHYIVKFETSLKRLEAAKIVLTKEVENVINAQNSDGDTLLHMVVRLRDTRLLEFLIERFSLALNPLVENNTGKTPIALAGDLKYQDMLDLLNQLQTVKAIF